MPRVRRLRTTWMPWIDRVRAERREVIDAVVDSYFAAHSPDAHGHIRVAMMRLEVEASIACPAYSTCRADRTAAGLFSLRIEPSACSRWISFKRTGRAGNWTD